MRLVLAMVVAGLVALPLSVSAQDAEEAATPEPSAEELTPTSEPEPEEEPATSSEPVPEEPSLQLKLDEAGVEVTPSPLRTFGGYTLEELELRKRRAAFGLIAPAAVTAAGVALLVVGIRGDLNVDPHWRSYASGIALTTAGGVGMIVGLSLLGARARAHRLAERDKYVGPSPTRTADGYTLEEMELRVKRARRGLLSSTGVLVLGGMIVGLALIPDEEYGRVAVAWGGIALVSAGSVGMIISGVLLADRKRDRDFLRQAHHVTPRRVQWDLVRSRLVF